MEKAVIEKSLYFHNPWWREKKVPAEFLPPFQRPIISQLKHYLESLERVIVIKGPRRAGKTTLLYQIVEYLMAKGVNPFNILFLSFDDLHLREELEEILHLYERIRGRTLKEPEVFCFLDEVHFLQDWSFTVKKYFDKRYPIKFLVSNSAASLFRKSLESLAGRTVEEVILPFTFKEFALYALRDNEGFFEFLREDRLAAYENELQILFGKYVSRGGFPHLLETEEPALWQKLLREDVLEKVIYRDLVQLYGVRDPEKLEKTFLYLARITGQLLNISGLAKNVGVSRQHLEKYIHYLEQAYLIFLLHRYSGSPAKTVRSATKLHLIDSGLCQALGMDSHQDFIIESVIARHLYSSDRHIFYYRNLSEVDLVSVEQEEVTPVEIKNKERPGKADFKGLVSFMRRFGLKEGIFLCRDFSGTEEIDGMKITIRPFWSWLLRL